MSIAAAQAARTVASGNISTTTIALIGAGTFCLANPEKALQLLQRALLALQDGRGGSDERGLARVPQQPIVIHAGTSTAGGGSNGGRGLFYMILQLHHHYPKEKLRNLLLAYNNLQGFPLN